MDNSQLPEFDQLPHVEGMPQGCAWSVFDTDGKKDLLGALNLLTSSVRKDAFAEARDSFSISHNGPLNGMQISLPGRISPVHKQMALQDAGLYGHRVTIEQIEIIARDQGVEFRLGDVLIICTGLTEVMAAPGPQDLAKLQTGQVSGMHGNLESAKWLWNKHFAAMAGDSWAFKAL